MPPTAHDRARRTISDETILEMRRLHKMGLSCKGIGAKLHVSPDYVSAVVKGEARADAK